MGPRVRPRALGPLLLLEAVEAHERLLAGLKPGRGQEEQLQRIKEGRDNFLREVRNDPVFGEQEMRQ